MFSDVLQDMYFLSLGVIISFVPFFYCIFSLFFLIDQYQSSALLY